MEANFKARHEEMVVRWQAEREKMQQESRQTQEAERQRLEQALQYMQTLGSAMGLSPPPFTAPPPPPRAATPTHVSDLTTL